MIKYLLFTLLSISVTCTSLIAQHKTSEKLLGVWQINTSSNQICLVFINSGLGAVTGGDGLLNHYFNYKLDDQKQPALITESIPIYGNNKSDYKALIQLKNDSVLMMNSQIKGKNASLMKGKKVSTYKKLLNVDAETFIRKPTLKDLTGTWINIFKHDTTSTLTFSSNNTMKLKNAKTNSEVSGRYVADFTKMPMTLDFINEKGDALPNIFAFVENSGLHLAGPKRGKRRAYFTFFGDNVIFRKEQKDYTQIKN